MASRTEPPLVSIITPTLNQAATLESTLRSVRLQTYPRVEHIVVDGGSTDGTREILARAAAGTGLRWQSGVDDGMYDAINKGIRPAAGAIIGYLNSDDMLLPWALEVAVAALQRTGAALVYGDAIRLEEGSSRIELKLQVPFHPRRLARYGSLVQPAVFWRRELAARVGEFDAGLQFVGDLDYWLRVGEHGPIAHVDEVLAVYRTHPAAKTYRFRSQMRSEEMRVRSRHVDAAKVTMSRQLLARLSHGLAVRRQLLRFALAGRSRGWERFRDETGARINWVRFWLAFLPLGGRLPVQDFVSLRRRPWD